MGRRLEKTISEFNDAVQPGDFVHTELDGCHTEGLEPKKSNWARKIDTPPFYAFPVKTGITFTYLGVEVNKSSPSSDERWQACREHLGGWRNYGGQRIGSGAMPLGPGWR